MSIESKNQSDENVVEEKSVDFNAKCIKLHKEKDWVKTEVIIKSIKDLRDVFSPYSDEVHQINIDKYHKVYTSVSFLNERQSLDGRVETNEEGVQMLVSPILLVLCDDTKPINISEDSLSFFEDKLDLFKD